MDDSNTTPTGFPTMRWVLAVVAAAGIALWPVWITSTPADPVVVGNAANLDFSLKDLDGKTVKLADFKGRPLILNFWATWCGPCKQEIPAFIELVEKYREEQLTVLGISVDDSPDDLREFVADYKINYPVLVGLGQDALQETYDAMIVVPVTWFIRPDGTVLLKHQGPASKEWFEKQVRVLVAPTPAS
jgi:peroxiredoxin